MPTENDKPPIGEIELGYLAENLPFLSRVLRAFIRAENAQFYADFGIEQGEIAIINLIGINPGLSQNDLAAAVVIKKSAVTHLVKGLEARGLVTREKGTRDKRFNMLRLTEAGEDLRQRLRARMVEQQEALLGPFSKVERAMLFDQMNRLCNHLAARTAARGPTE
ncbi:MAG: MarR family winged helix-turn-helix transcriptional regulator [Azospirillaceae bacterium]